MRTRLRDNLSAVDLATTLCSFIDLSILSRSPKFELDQDKPSIQSCQLALVSLDIGRSRNGHVRQAMTRETILEEFMQPGRECCCSGQYGINRNLCRAVLRTYGSLITQLVIAEELLLHYLMYMQG